MRQDNSAVAMALAFMLSFGAQSPAFADQVVTSESVTFLAATRVDPEASVRAELRLPESPAKLPAVVIIHGSGGLFDRAGDDYIAALNKAGIATLQLNLFPKGGRPASPRLNLPHTYGSLIYLARHPRIDPARVGVMGFSWGGVLSIQSASSELNEIYTSGQYKFAAHLPLYPVCWSRQWEMEGHNKFYPTNIYKSVTGAPVHILAGEDDQYDDSDSCPKFVQALPDTVRKYFAVTIYPGAGHSWDTHENRNGIDPAAYKGRGGNVSHYRNDKAAAQSLAFAVKFFSAMPPGK